MVVTRVYVYGLLHRSGFVEGVKGIYLLSDDTAHMRNNTENFCVGPFYWWESKIKIYWLQRVELGLQEHLLSWEDRKYDMSDADKPEFAKQSFKGFVMRIMMMIDMFKKKSD